MEEEDEEEEEPCRERKQEGRSTHEPTDKNSNLPSKPFPQLIVFFKESYCFALTNPSAASLGVRSTMSCRMCATMCFSEPFVPNKNELLWMYKS